MCPRRPAGSSTQVSATGLAAHAGPVERRIDGGHIVCPNTTRPFAGRCRSTKLGVESIRPDARSRSERCQCRVRQVADPGGPVRRS